MVSFGCGKDDVINLASCEHAIQKSVVPRPKGTQDITLCLAYIFNYLGAFMQCHQKLDQKNLMVFTGELVFKKRRTTLAL